MGREDAVGDSDAAAGEQSPGTAHVRGVRPRVEVRASIVPCARLALLRPAMARRPYALSQAQPNGGAASGGRQRRACRCWGASRLRAGAAGGSGPHTAMLDEGTRALNLARGRVQPFLRGKCRRGLPSAAAKASLGAEVTSRQSARLLSTLGARVPAVAAGRRAADARAMCPTLERVSCALAIVTVMNVRN